MNEKNLAVDEQAAADAICAVEDLAASPVYEPNGRDTAPDWRVRCDDGRVADVEVIRSTNEAAKWFTQSLSPHGSARVWPDVRLSFGWTVVVSDHICATDRRLNLKKLMAAVRDVLISVESHNSSLGQMKQRAQSKLRADEGVRRCLGHSRNPGGLEYLEYPGEVDVVKNPEPPKEGDESGWVRTYGSHGYGSPAHTIDLEHDDARLVRRIQECIDHKANGPWLDSAPDLKWLAVMPERETRWLFEEFFGPDSPTPRPTLEGVSLCGFDEVWVIIGTQIGKDRKEGFAVLRLSEGGAQQRHIVSRSQPSASG